MSTTFTKGSSKKENRHQSKNDDHSLSSAQEINELPESIVQKADYSCYCKVCDCTLSRMKDVIQHIAGKRHKKACESMNEAGVKRTATEYSDNKEKKMKTDENPQKDEEAKKMLSKVFDETFHSGVVALLDNYYCKVCRCTIGNNRKNVNQHKEGKSHKMALDTFKKSLLSGKVDNDIPVEDPNQPFEGDEYIEKRKNAKRKTLYYCRICDFRTKVVKDITEHMHGNQHQRKICIEKEKKKMTQQGGYFRGHYEDHYRTEIRMHPEKSYNEMEMKRSESQWPKPFLDRGDPSFHGDYQNSSNETNWNQNYENFVPPMNPNYENFVPPMNPNALMLPQMRPVQQSDAFFPQFNQVPQPFIPHPQQIQDQFMVHSHQPPVPFMPQPQMTPFPDPSQFQPQQPQVSAIIPSQQDTLPVTSVQQFTQKTESNEPCQTNSSASSSLIGFITNENDADVVIDVINSLLNTYLKFRLQALPGSFMKLLCKSTKTEENVTRINTLATGKTAKQIFIKTQSQKNKVQSKTTTEDQRLPSNLLYERRSEKHAENRSSKSTPINELPYSESVYYRSVDKKFDNSYDIPKTSNKSSHSYDQRSYIEDQIKKSLSGRNIVEGQNELSVADFSKWHTGSSNDNISQKGYKNKSFNKEAGFSKDKGQNYSSKSLEQYRDSSNDDYSREYATNILPRDPRKMNRSRTDFSNRYRSSGTDDRSSNVFTERNKDFRSADSCSRSGYQNTESVVDFFKRYRSSNTSSHK